MKKFETMSEFFDKRADTYESHMKENAGSAESFDQFYSRVSGGISNTQDRVRILDIGCGTGLEMEGIFERAPNAALTGVDLSGEMLNKLRIKYESRLDQITLVQKSYLTLPFGKETYDYIISVNTLHHLLPDQKLRLYRKIKKALKPNGKYMEGDYVVAPEKAKQLLSKYNELSRSDESIKAGIHHFDIPFSLDTQKQILVEAGFLKVEVLLQEREGAIYVASI